MNTLKYCLLSCTAAVVAVSGAQAADLPVKAKPVEYVKVCSLYGAGFWYVPGTDTCLKVGAYIRTQADWNGDGGGIAPGAGNASGRSDRSDNSDFEFRSRQAISIDLRTQTEYGTLRSYLEIGAQVTAGGTASAGSNATAADAVFVDRGFVQFAGFTVGRIRSFFDINTLGQYSYANSRVSGDTSINGITAWAYTAQLGNGVSASLSLEDPGLGSLSGRGRLTADVSQPSFSLTGISTTTDNRGAVYPDVVGALRIDQAWGYAQVAAALHDVSGGYYGNDAAGIGNGHPDDKLGWAVTGGFTLNNVLGLKGDQFGMQAAYSQGAAGYVTRATGMWGVWSGNSAGFGNVTDGIFTNGSDIELTEVFGVNGFYQHFWNPKWKTSLYGGYVGVNHTSEAKSFICGAGGGLVNPAGYAGLSAVSNCNPDFSWWQVGTRTQWNPHPDLDIGVDVLYTRLNTAFKGAGVVASSGAQTAKTEIEDQDILSVMFRVQRNFLP